MPRNRAGSTISTSTNGEHGEQELSSMYDYLAKVILIGPSGCGKSCLLHRFVKDEWRIYTSQTIGVEFASKIVKVGTGARRKRIKLQLWDTAGTERFRSVSRSYYRGSAAAILVYDVASLASFRALPTFLHDARALASRQLVVLLAGNKSDLFDGGAARVERLVDAPAPSPLRQATNDGNGPAISRPDSMGTMKTATKLADAGATREVSPNHAADWAEAQGVHTAVEVSALSGDGVEALFTRLAATILTRIELGEIDPDDPSCGIQYGDSFWGDMNGEESARGSVRRRGWTGGSSIRELEGVFRVGGRRRAGCC